MASNIDNASGNLGTFKDFLLSGNGSEKKSYQWGRVVAQNINGTIRGNQGYFFNRNARFRANRQLANGRYDMRRFMDRMDMDGKFNYVNINWKAPLIVNTTITRKVSQWMGRSEKIVVSAVDPVSVSAKNDAAAQAEFYLEHKEEVAALEQASGISMTPKDQFVPEDKDALDEWVSEFNHLPEEIKYEMGVNTILDKNGFFGVNKEKVLHDSAEVGMVGTFTWMDETGQIHVDWVRPENMIYSYSEYPDFRDTAWRGHIYSLKISELRAKYGKQCNPNNPHALTEEEIFEIAGTSKNYQVSDKITWLDQYTVAFIRPYDEWNVDAVRFELRSVDSEGYTFSQTKKNKSTILSKGKPSKQGMADEYVEDKKWNIYEGVFIANRPERMLSWGIKKNMIRPQDPKELGDAEFSYSFYMPQNYEMRNIAIPEKIEEPVEQMILARLKIQQLVAKMKPAGASINVDAMQELDLGLANGVAKPLEVQRIWEQTGNLYYRGRDAEGNPIPMPISELANAGFSAQLQSLIQLYQFHYSVLKDELGDDPNLAQQASRPRVTEGNVQVAQTLADNATDVYYDSYLYLMEETSKKVACLLNVSVTHGGQMYREILKEDEVEGRIFQTSSKMLPTEQEQLELKQMMNTALMSTPRLSIYLDQFKIARLAKDDIKLAELYFRNATKRMLKSEQEMAQQNSQENAKIQQASMQAKSEGDMQLEDKKNLAKEKQIILTGSFELLKAGVAIPDTIMPILTGVIENATLPIMLENEQLKAEAQQAMQQQQQQAMQEQQEGAMQQQQEQEQGTEQPMESQEPLPQ